MSQVAVLTGGTGRVGSIFLNELIASRWRVITVGRGQAPTASWRHVRWDLAADPPPEASEILGQDVGLLILCAGVECQETAISLQDGHFRAVMQINCGGHLSLVREIAKACRGQWRVVAVSSDVVTSASKASLVYSASKAALEVGVRDAVADCDGNCDAVILRLPYLGWPMSNYVGELAHPEMGPALRPESLVRLIQSCLTIPFLAGGTRLIDGSLP